MKLTYFQLESHLAKSIASLYIISGEDLLQKQDAIQLVRKAAKKAGFERVRLSAEVCTDEDQLYSSLYSVSLLAEKRLFEFDFRESTPNKIVSTILQEYAEKPLQDTILLIDCGKIDAKIAKSAWYKAFEKNGMVVTIWPIQREQLPQWIQQRARKYKLQFNPDATQLLADYVQGNLIAAAQTIEKCYLLKPQKTIDSELLQTILTDESHFTIFDFIDHFIAGDKKQSLHVLQNLKEEGIEPVLILWGITRELRILADYARQIQQGITYDQLFQQQRIFSRRQAPIRQFLNKFKVADCWQLLTHAAELDNIIKGATPGNVWEGLQMFCLRVV
jgi:DNA polymerase-3 subunit delta